MTTRPTYIIRLRPQPGVERHPRVAAALKLLRRFGLKAIEVKEEEATG